MSGSIDRLYAFVNRESVAPPKMVAVNLTPAFSAAATSRVCAPGDGPVAKCIPGSKLWQSPSIKLQICEASGTVRDHEIKYESQSALLGSNQNPVVRSAWRQALGKDRLIEVSSIA